MGARQQPANVDETSMGRRRWLRTSVTAVATVYQIVTGRNRQALLALVGAYSACLDQRSVRVLPAKSDHAF